MKKMTKTGFIGLLLAIVMAFSLFSGCGQQSNDNDPAPSAPPAGSTSTAQPDNAGQTSAGDSTKKDSLTIALHVEPATLGTVDNDSLASIYMNLLTYNLLFKADPETLDVVPDLCESYEQTSDTEYIFKLHEGVMFHHGKELDSGDVVASIKNAQTMPASAPYTGMIANVEAVSKYEVKITTTQPYSNLLYDLAYHFNYILPADLLESGHDFATQPVGTGPYTFVNWERGTSLTFERNDNYWDKNEMPTIKNIIWKIIPEGTSRTLALETGEVDVIYNVETADVARLQANDKFHVEQKTSVDNYYMCLNTDVAPFNDVNLRQAINCAIDREAIIVGALNGYGTPSYSAVPMGYYGSWDANANKYDLEKAKSYLAAWGGDPSSVNLVILARTDEHIRVATIIQACLSEIGINVTIEQIDNPSWVSRRSSGDYIASITSWSPSNCFTYLTRYASTRASSMPGALQDAETDALIETMKSASGDAQLEAMHKVIERVNDLAPHISLWQAEYFRAWDAKLEGIVISASGYVRFHTAKWAD